MKREFFIQTIAVLITVFTNNLCAEQTIEERDFSTFFGTYEGTIVVYDRFKEKYYIHNKKRSETRFTPFSTFKIPNSIIGLETGVIKSVDSIFQWDTTKYLPEEWWPVEWKHSHTMRSAIKFSVVPFYRELATRVGEKRLRDFVKKFKYGNIDISSGIDKFWLGGSLAISAMEQVEFLKNFYDNKLGVKEETIRAVKEILVQETDSSYTISAKTGGGSGFKKDDPQRALGWYVGYVDNGKDVYFFATNIEGKNTLDIREPRIAITRSVLKELHIIY